MQNLLFIDDDIDLLCSNEKYFANEGYHVKIADTPQSALGLLMEFEPDCIILDIMLPQVTGFELYKEIRAVSNAPVIFLSGRTAESDRVNGLLLGGNDYMTKPYSLPELSARIQVQIRNTATRLPASMLSFPPLTVDVLAHKVFYHEAEIPFSNQDYQLLYRLVSTPNEIVTYQDIGQSVWGYYIDSDRRTIMVTISRLRKKLEDYTGLDNMIETVWAKGYKFVGSRRRQG